MGRRRVSATCTFEPGLLRELDRRRGSSSRSVIVETALRRLFEAQQDATTLRRLARLVLLFDTGCMDPPQYAEMVALARDIPQEESSWRD